MSSNADLLALAKQRLYPNYRPAPFALVRGRGCELFDADGRRMLDLCAGIAVCVVGHAHPTLVRAIADQAATLMHVSNWFYNEPNIRAADELCRRTGFARAFFCNSGTEANEAMLKLARHHFYGIGQPERVRVVAFENAFHGRTLGALSMTPKYREGFGPLGPATHVPFGDAEAVERAMGPDVCAIIVEPLQGEGGVLPAPAGFLAKLRSIADRHGALLLVDEIQTGVGRLGRFLATEGTGARPDAVSLAKGLAGGVPIGAMVTTEKLSGALPPGTHGSTFGGNALASAAALAVMRILDEEGLIEGARTKGEALGAMLRQLVAELPDVLESARGEGLLWGLVMRPGLVAREILPRIQEAGVLLTGAGDSVLRFSPALVVSIAELEEGVLAVRRVLGELRTLRATA
jgi:acetylornithine/N-succinyldiaminopimelate aminotransferase